MNATTALLHSEADHGSGFLRRAGRTLLGSAAILIVGAGAAPAAHAATGAGPAGLRAVTAQHSAPANGPTSLPAESRSPAARFVVGEDGRLTRLI
ncbi:hypothetical protein [Flexivirga sp. B27]